MNARSCLALLALPLFLGCDAAPPPDAGAGRLPAPAAAEPEFLPTPFTAEQIRDEWVKGFTLVMSTETTEGGSLERWTVLEADAEGAEIEFQPIDDAGEATGEANVGRSSWEELRDHAKYRADIASRERFTRETALGTFDGWLYRVSDAEAGTTTTVFFAAAHPGAPFYMRVEKDGEEELLMVQLSRSQPGSDPM